MKKILNLIILVSILVIAINKTEASVVDFNQAMSQVSKKPAIVFIYADWADGMNPAYTQFRAIQSQFGDKFNYVDLDIASPSAKAFNENNVIYPKLPYIMMYRNNGKISRYVPRECIVDEACIMPKVKAFLH